MTTPTPHDEPRHLEPRAYGPDSTPEDIERLEAQVYEYAPELIMYREAPVLSLFQIDAYHRRLQELTASMSRFDVIIDLSLTRGRPDAAMRARLKRHFTAYPQLERVVVFTKKNMLLNVAAGFILGGLGFKSIKVVKTKEEALQALLGHGA